jgi:hypothetical protein
MFSPMLLHLNVGHLVMNMIALLSFGMFLERLIGSARYLVLYVFSGVCGSALCLLDANTWTVGASGGIWGLMVAGAVVVTWPRGLFPEALALQMRGRAWSPVIINLVYSLQPGISMRAHLGGGLGGALLILVLAKAPAPLTLPRPSVAMRAIAATAAVVLAASMGIALVRGKPWLYSEVWTLVRSPLGASGLSMEAPDPMGPGVPSSGGTAWKWGGLNEVGAEVHVFVGETLPEPVKDTRSALEELRPSLADFGKETLRYKTPMELVTLPSGQNALFGEQVPRKAEDHRFVWVWWLIEGRHSLMVLENVMSDASEERKVALRRMVDSVHAEDSPK